MNKSQLLGLVCATILSLFANTLQAQELQWTRSLVGAGADGSWDVISDGDVIHVLDVRGSVLRQYNSEGTLQWLTTYLGSSVKGFAVASNSIDSSIYVGGRTTINLPDQVPLESAGAFLRKYDSSYNEIWTRIFGAENGEAVFDIAVDASGVYVVVSPALPFNYPPILPYIEKFDHDGDSLWKVTLGGFEFDFAWGVDVHEDAVYVTGEFDFGTAVLWRLDRAGNIIWRKPLDLGTTFGTDAGRSVVVAGTGNAIYIGGVAGSTGFGNTASGHYRYSGGEGILAKFNAAGTQLWNQSVSMDVAEGVSVDGNGRVVVAGSAENLPSAAVAQYDAYGNKLWGEIFNIRSTSTDDAQAVSTANGAIYVAGRTADDSLSPSRSVEGFLAKFAIGGGPFVRCPGDVNGDSIADIAVTISNGNTRIKGLDGRLVSQFNLSEITSVVDVEIMPDTNTNGSPEFVMVGSRSVEEVPDENPNAAEVWDSLTASQLAPFISPFDHIPTDPLTLLDLELVEDQTGNEIHDLVNLAKGSVRIEAQAVDYFTGQLINTLRFDKYVVPEDLEIYPDLNGNGSPELAVLGENKDPAKSDKIEIRDLETGNKVRDIWLGKGWQVLQQEVISDRNGNGYPEATVLRSKNDETQYTVLIRDTKSGRWLGTIYFDPEYPPQKLLTITDVNGNDADEVVVFGPRFDGRNQKAQVKDSKTKKTIRAVFFDPNAPGQDIATCPDINGNGSEELVMLGKRNKDGKLKAIVKDSKTGERLGVVTF